MVTISPFQTWNHAPPAKNSSATGFRAAMTSSSLAFRSIRITTVPRFSRRSTT
jgi:hypothetical protein